MYMYIQVLTYALSFQFVLAFLINVVYVICICVLLSDMFKTGCQLFNW